MPKLPKATPNKWIVQKRKTFKSLKVSKHSKFYSSKVWKDLRAYFIAEYPLCKWCEEEGVVKEANIVDHIVEINDGGDKLNEDNLMSLCHRHHLQKTNWARSKRKKQNKSDEL